MSNQNIIHKTSFFRKTSILTVSSAIDTNRRYSVNLILESRDPSKTTEANALSCNILVTSEEAFSALTVIRESLMDTFSITRQGKQMTITWNDKGQLNVFATSSTGVPASIFLNVFDVVQLSASLANFLSHELRLPIDVVFSEVRNHADKVRSRFSC